MEGERVGLTFKGQFVVSARRVRGIKREVWEGLLGEINEGCNLNLSAGNKTIGDDGGREVGIGQGLGIGSGEPDTPSNPHFGFSLERIWGLLMQCATDQVITARCPSLLSEMSRGGDVRDCQCLDEGVGWGG